MRVAIFTFFNNEHKQIILVIIFYKLMKSNSFTAALPGLLYGSGLVCSSGERSRWLLMVRLSFVRVVANGTYQSVWLKMLSIETI